MITSIEFKARLKYLTESIFKDDLYDSYYHYTKTDYLEEIFKTNNIFVSNKNCMNDQYEVDYPKNLLLTELKNFDDEEAIRFIDYFNEIWRNEKLYSFSISSNDNCSYLIENYGKSIIKIDSKKLKLANIKNYGKPSWRFGKVIYKLSEQKKYLNVLLGLYFDIEKVQIERDSDIEYEELENIQYELVNHISVALDLFKDENEYSKEEETRIIFYFEGNSDKAEYSRFINNKEKKYIIIENIDNFAQLYKTCT